MGVYSSDGIMGPEGLFPILLVYGALPRHARINPLQTQLKIQEAIEDAKLSVDMEQAKRRIDFAQRHPSGPKGKDHSRRLRDLF